MKGKIMIVKDKGICGGAPRIKGSRLTVNGVLSYLASGYSINEIVKSVNKTGVKISKEQIKEAINYSIGKVR